ncbi:MAG: type II toxin-antitoxin system Phd/YefM family antitoxin [Chthonomonadales bacterium]
MIKLDRDVQSLTEFKRNTSDYLDQMRETHSPIVLTVNGKAEVVVQDVESYQKMLERLDLLDSIEGMRRGLVDMKNGNTRPAKEVFEEMFVELGITKDANP